MAYRNRNSNQVEVVEPEEIPLNADNDVLEPKPEAEEKKTFVDNVKYFFRNVTIEPTVMMFIIGFMITTLTTTNLSLEKACRVNLNFTDEICTAMRKQELENQNSYEREAQRLLASALSWKTYITATVPCIIGLFVGPWQDKTGHRKIFLIIPLIGLVLCCVNSIIQVYFFYELNLETLVFSEAVLEGFSGGMCVMVITIFAFISAITTTETRTFRMGMVNFSLTVGFPIGIASSGFILSNLGYYGSYGIAMGIHLVNIAYNAIVLKDPPRSSDQKKHDRRGFLHFCRTFFDLSNIKETIQVVFSNVPNGRRLRMCILLLVVTILFGPMFGEMSILYMSTRYRFNWDEVKFSIFQTYNFVTHTIGTIFSITVFSRYLKWHDSMLGIISTISKIASSFVYCFAPNETIFFLGPLVEILNGTALLAIRSITSKLVESNELDSSGEVLFSLQKTTVKKYFVISVLCFCWEGELNIRPHGEPDAAVVHSSVHQRVHSHHGGPAWSRVPACSDHDHSCSDRVYMVVCGTSIGFAEEN